MNCLYTELLVSAQQTLSSVSSGGWSQHTRDHSEIVTAEIDKVGVNEVVTHESDNISTMAASAGVKGEAAVQSKYNIILIFHHNAIFLPRSNSIRNSHSCRASDLTS